MKASTKQILKITMDPNRTLHRMAIRWESEHLEFVTGTREDRIAIRGWFLAWAVGQTLMKALGYHGFKSDGVKYYNYMQDSVIFFLMMSVYWVFTRFSAILTRAKIPIFKAYEPNAVPTNWAL